eukprot:CAMPEP_0177635210 /NCGR_PEP_ID=MMETSP0447-20121125/3781_1 /TAXON_ID=0 /ORGANISM="Stygamoeba regulata, Strain BSH-02190019" /LENGTH=503 /DNA_ID=CAMNT_0019136985 /DNA_START=433 /DNA_END=1944 /DNA_ORIENTATION=-
MAFYADQQITLELLRQSRTYAHNKDPIADRVYDCTVEPEMPYSSSLEKVASVHSASLKVDTGSADRRGSCNSAASAPSSATPKEPRIKPSLSFSRAPVLTAQHADPSQLTVAVHKLQEANRKIPFCVFVADRKVSVMLAKSANVEMLVKATLTRVTEMNKWRVSLSPRWQQFGLRVANPDGTPDDDFPSLTHQANLGPFGTTFLLTGGDVAKFWETTDVMQVDLPDQQMTKVQVGPKMTTAELIDKVIRKRGLSMTARYALKIRVKDDDVELQADERVDNLGIDEVTLVRVGEDREPPTPASSSRSRKMTDSHIMPPLVVSHGPPCAPGAATCRNKDMNRRNSFYGPPQANSEREERTASSRSRAALVASRSRAVSLSEQKPSDDTVALASSEKGRDKERDKDKDKERDKDRDSGESDSGSRLHRKSIAGSHRSLTDDDEDSDQQHKADGQDGSKTAREDLSHGKKLVKMGTNITSTISMFGGKFTGSSKHKKNLSRGVPPLQ